MHSQILDIPGDVGDRNTALGRFAGEMKQSVGFQPGDRMHTFYSPILAFCSAKFVYGEGTFIETPFGVEKDTIFFSELTTPERLVQLEKVLQSYDVRYAKNSDFFRLCCPGTTEQVQSVFLYNNVLNHPLFGRMPEMLLFLSSSVELSRVKAIAYVPSFTEEDKRLQRAHLDDIVDRGEGHFEGDWDCGVPPYDIERFPNRAIAEELSGEHNIGRAIVEYPDGVTFGLDGVSLPLVNIFGKENPVGRYSVGTCPNCSNDLDGVLKTRAIAKLEDERGKVLSGGLSLYHELFDEVAQRIGYAFDFNRIKVEMSKEPVPVYNG